MKKIIYFGASSSRKSINAKLAEYCAHKLENVQVNSLDLNEYEMPIYSIDLEKSDGIPNKARSFCEELQSSDGVIISFAEHNGSYTAAFKNILDWVSRLEVKAWKGLKLFILSTSPGARGGATVHKSAMTSFPHFGAEVTANFIFPAFNENFDASKNDGVMLELKTEINHYQQSISGSQKQSES